MSTKESQALQRWRAASQEDRDNAHQEHRPRAQKRSPTKPSTKPAKVQDSSALQRWKAHQGPRQSQRLTKPTPQTTHQFEKAIKDAQLAVEAAEDTLQSCISALAAARDDYAEHIEPLPKELRGPRTKPRPAIQASMDARKAKRAAARAAKHKAP